MDVVIVHDKPIFEVFRCDYFLFNISLNMFCELVL